jgi:hypothetical protein
MKVATNVLFLSGLGFEWCVNVHVKLFKSILCCVKQYKCKCKSKYIPMILCWHIKLCKCKNKPTYMVLHGYVYNNVKKRFLLREGGNFIMFLVIGQPNDSLQKKKFQNIYVLGCITTN